MVRSVVISVGLYAFAAFARPHPDNIVNKDSKAVEASANSAASNDWPWSLPSFWSGTRLEEIGNFFGYGVPPKDEHTVDSHITESEPFSWNSPPDRPSGKGRGSGVGNAAPAKPAAPALPAAKAKPIWMPKVSSPFQIILSGVLDMKTVQVTPHPNNSAPKVSGHAVKAPVLTPNNVEIFDIDLWETPRETVDHLHNMGKKVICYFSAGTGEDWRPDYSQFRDAHMGANLPMWRGERWLDIRTKEVWNVMQKRIQLASTRGCDAIDPDNVDGYDNEKGGGFKKPLTKKDTIAYVRKISREAARYGMSTGLKNAQGILKQVEADIHFAVNEECAGMKECRVYDGFMKGSAQFPAKPVFHIEYVKAKNGTHPKTGQLMYEIVSAMYPKANSSQIRKKVCLGGETTGNKLSTVIKEFNLNGWVMYCDGSSTVTRTVIANTGPGPRPELGARFRRMHLEEHPSAAEYQLPLETVIDPDVRMTILDTENRLDDVIWSSDIGPIDELGLEDDPNAKKRGAGKDRIGPNGPIGWDPENIVDLERRDKLEADQKWSNLRGV